VGWPTPKTITALALPRYARDISFKSAGLYTLNVFVFEMRGEINVYMLL
jgi:hypothetical protein